MTDEHQRRRAQKLSTTVELLDLADHHFLSFAKHFVDHALYERWQDLYLSSNPVKWEKIDPWKLWDPAHQLPTARYTELATPVPSIKDDRTICPNPAQTAVVIGLGLRRASLRVLPVSALQRDDLPVEGLISLEPGKRVIVMNHDGEALICTR